MTFYATIDSDSVRSYMPDVPYLLPASSWARYNLRSPKLPAHVRETAADSGGYVATFRWGNYRYTPAQYVGWLSSWIPKWAATMDYCCEPEITEAKKGLIVERQERTSEKAWYLFDRFKRNPWVWVPTIQGWEVEDYITHARVMKPLIEKMSSYYRENPAFRVGIGTLCRRASPQLVREIAAAVSAELPGVPIHLWGIKLTAIKIGLPVIVASVDSAAWNNRFGRKIEEQRRSGMSQRRYAYLVSLPEYLSKVARYSSR